VIRSDCPITISNPYHVPACGGRGCLKKRVGGFLGLNNKQKSISGDSGKKQLFLLLFKAYTKLIHTLLTFAKACSSFPHSFWSIEGSPFGCPSRIRTRACHSCHSGSNPGSAIQRRCLWKSVLAKLNFLLLFSEHSAWTSCNKLLAPFLPGPNPLASLPIPDNQPDYSLYSLRTLNF